MGFFGTFIAFSVGGACGVYVAQNYDIPNLRKLMGSGCTVAKHLEETYRMPAQPKPAKIDNPDMPEPPQIKN